MATRKSVFIVGPGFIGGEILDLLHQERYSITALVRREEHANQLQKDYGVKTIMGSLDDWSLIKEQTTSHDIVIHSATADHLPSVEAIINGIKARTDEGLSAIYIHTSGTSVLDDGAMGEFKSDKIYHDNVRSEADSVPRDAPHRKVDLTVVKAQKQLGPLAKFAIMTPPLIYGFSKQKRLSIQIPTLTRFALKHGFVPHVGAGLSVESNIHVSDLARGYITLLHHLESSSGVATMSNPYYYCETTSSNEPSWKDVAAVIGQGLYAAGKIQSPEPRSLDEGLYRDTFGAATGAIIGLNSRSRAIRLRALGWQPREKEWRESFLEDELPEILKEDTGPVQGYVGVAAK